MSDNVVSLPVAPRADEGDCFLAPVPASKCQHFPARFEVDVKAGKCSCKTCGEEVAPMFVLEMLMREESQWMQSRAKYQDSMRRLAERSRTKCEHCGQITRIRQK